MFKVIIDRKTNRNADTGRFELIYKALAVTVPNYIGIDLKIDGHSYKKPIQQTLINLCNNNNNNPSSHTISNKKKDNESEVNLSLSGSEIKSTRNTIVSAINNKATTTTPTTTLSTPISTSIKLRKETTVPTISIANSIQELAQKEIQTQNHLANYQNQYRSHNNLSNISYNYLLPNPEKSIKRSNLALSKEEVDVKEQKNKTMQSIPKLFQFPPNASTNTNQNNNFKASPTLTNSHLSTFETNSISNQTVSAKPLNSLASTSNSIIQPPPLPPSSSISGQSNPIKLNKGKLEFKPAFESYPNINKIENYFLYSKNLNRQKSFANYYATLIEQDKLRNRFIEQQAEENSEILVEKSNEKILSKENRSKLVCSSLQVADLNDLFISEYDYEINEQRNLADRIKANVKFNDLTELEENEEEIDPKIVNKTTKLIKNRPHTSPKIIILKLSKNKNKVRV